MTDLSRKLNAHLQALEAAAQALETSRADRDKAIKAAAKAGLTRRQIAAAVGLTAGRVQQIISP